MDSDEKKIGVRELGKLFGWSPAKVKKTLNKQGACLPDGTPSGKWASKVLPKIVTCQYSGQPVVKYLWPKNEIIEDLERNGFNQLSTEEKKRKINSWYNLDKILDGLCGIAYEKTSISSKKGAALHSKTLNCAKLAATWVPISRTNRRLVTLEIQRVFQDYLKTKIRRKPLKEIIKEDTRSNEFLKELSNFLRRQRYKKLSKEVLAWLD
jgi:hypothetical protein